ncbi:MAG: FAD-binding oxidoreductase [bacterium]
MAKLVDFIAALGAEFDNDRLTYQNTVATFHPESVAEAARLFRLANKFKQPMYIAGFGNNITPVGAKFEAMVTVCTDRLNSVIEVSSQDLFVTVGAGFPLRELNHHLAPHNLFIPHAYLPYVGSVGGALATGLRAELGGHEIPLKRFFLKAEIVTPQGEVITPGSVCFKSVSGYDVVKVFAGSWGVLGLIATASLRTIPDSARHEYDDMIQMAPNREAFLAGLIKSNVTTDAVYSRKIKQKFDPNVILPVV